MSMPVRPLPACGRAGAGEGGAWRRGAGAAGRGACTCGAHPPHLAVNADDVFRVRGEPGVHVGAKARHDFEHARVVVLKGEAHDAAAKVAGVVRALGAEVVDAVAAGVPRLEKALHLRQRVAVQAFAAHARVAHGDDAPRDVRQVEVKAVGDEAPLLLGHERAQLLQRRAKAHAHGRRAEPARPAAAAAAAAAAGAVAAGKNGRRVLRRRRHGGQQRRQHFRQRRQRRRAARGPHARLGRRRAPVGIVLLVVVTPAGSRRRQRLGGRRS